MFLGHWTSAPSVGYTWQIETLGNHHCVVPWVLTSLASLPSLFLHSLLIFLLYIMSRSLDVIIRRGRKKLSLILPRSLGFEYILTWSLVEFLMDQVCLCVCMRVCVIEELKMTPSVLVLTRRIELSSKEMGKIGKNIFFFFLVGHLELNFGKVQLEVTDI